MAELNAADIVQMTSAIIVALAVVIGMVRGIVTKKDCKEYRATCTARIDNEFDDLDDELEKGTTKFEELTTSISSHGERLARLEPMVTSIDSNVKMLVRNAVNNGRS